MGLGSICKTGPADPDEDEGREKFTGKHADM